MRKLRVFHWLLMAALAASLPITAQAAGGTAWEADPISQADVVSRFTMAASITASLVAAVSFAVTVSSFATVSSQVAVSDSSVLVSLIHIHILIPIIGIQGPIGAIRVRQPNDESRLTVREANCAAEGA
jgi:hypothetical protein